MSLVIDDRLNVSMLRSEYLVDPIGIDAVRPRLSWVPSSGKRGVTQAAYEILVASDRAALDRDEGDLWASGRVESSDSAQIVYAGVRLRARQRAWWKVRVLDNEDVVSAWSDAAFWERGLSGFSRLPGESGDLTWTANWIADPGLAPDPGIPEAAEHDALLPVPLFRTSFEVTKEIVRARLYATARGVYEARLNGAKVGDHQLAPGWTDYAKRVQYQTFDVTDSIQPGENVLGAMVGTGWFAGRVAFPPGVRHYGTTPQFLAQLHLDYVDGTTEVIVTDRTWMTQLGPIRYSDFLMGEYYDATRERPGWDSPGYDRGDWNPVQIQSKNATPFVSEPAEPVRAQEEFVPASRSEIAPGVFVFDLGQNIAGWVRLKASGPAGTTVMLRFAEILNPDGTLYVTNLRSARVIDTFVLAGTGLEVFEPRFAWHGFRYVEVSGYPGTPEIEDVTGVFVGSDTRPVGTFTSSDELLNQLQRNIIWGQRGNFLSVPTDCPQRDERLGWLGDAQVFVGTAVGNMDVAGFFTKWMRDVADAQSLAGAFPDVAPRLADLSDGAPAWADCGVIVPWTIWKTYGDTGIIDEHWHAMDRWMSWLERGNPDCLWKYGRHNDFGDWLSIGADTPKELIGTAYWAYDAGLMIEMAAATGRASEEGRFRALRERIEAAFNDAYVRADGSIEGETQTVYCLALHFGLLPEELRSRAAGHLVADIAAKGGHLSTGFVGVSYLCHVLTANGYPDVAFALLHQRTFPSWNYSILHGATTIWERWDGWTEEKGFQDPGMNSFNHYSLGSVGEWLRKSVAGIDNVPGTSGYRQIRIKPYLDPAMTFAEGSYDSIRGPIRSRWERSDDRVTFDVEIPANTRGEIWLPGSSTESVMEGTVPVSEAAGVTDARVDGDRVVVGVGSGSYRFVVAAAGR
jgi:alpha-L-rhamnosidase